MDNASLIENDELQGDEKDEPNKHSGHIYENNHYLDDNELLHSEEQNLTSSTISEKHDLKDYTESPRTKLAKYIPEVPFKINGNLSQLCDSKIFVKPTDLANGHNSFHVSLSLEDEFEDSDHVYSKSCDCGEDIIDSLQQNGPTISRSISEDFLQRPSAAFQRRISIVSTSKGKLIGVPRVRPGEKLVRSPSNVSTGQISFRQPTRISVDEEDLPLKSKFTAEQRWIAFCLCLVDFTAFLSMSIIAPFFPREVGYYFIFFSFLQN